MHVGLTLTLYAHRFHSTRSMITCRPSTGTRATGRCATLPSSRHLQPTNSKLAAIYSLTPTPHFAFEDADMRLRLSKSTSDQSASVPFLSSALLWANIRTLVVSPSYQSRGLTARKPNFGWRIISSFLSTRIQGRPHW